MNSLTGNKLNFTIMALQEKAQKSMQDYAKDQKTSERKTSSTNGHDSALYKLFVDELKDIYWAEEHLVQNLPKMVKAATSPKLKKVIEDHLSETKNQVVRIQKVFEMIGEKAQAVKCEAMEGLVKEAAEIIETTQAGSKARDAGLIISAQKVEHYEIASYGALRTLAMTLGQDKAAELLKETLNEEKNADNLLTQTAVWDVNKEAIAEKA